jgi:hypothetical protein
VRVGQQCSKPHDCEFAGYCRAFLPDEDPITEIPHIREASLHALLDLGITSIRDISPVDIGVLSANQAHTVRVVQSGEPYVDVEGLRRDLARLNWPARHLDFETIMPALPLWEGTRPYETVPFQYSIHIHAEDGTAEHREYLHVGGTDPRRPLAERMLSDLGETGSITHYTGYELRVLNGLASALPDLASRIAALMPRMVDLEPIIRTNTKHPAQRGRTSIKCVLPAWCPDLSYADLGISDGQVASVRYLRACRGMMDAEAAEAVYSDLREYCDRDTYAMVRLLEVLREQAR